MKPFLLFKGRTGERSRPREAVMTEFKVTHTCGHEVAHRFGGPEPQRVRRQNWLRSQPCQACWHQQQRAASSAASEKMGLPPLQGSPTEVAWAEVIRSKAIRRNLDFYRRANRRREGNPETDAVAEAIRAATDEAMEELKSQTEAQWWIDNRFEVLSLVRKAAVRAVDPILNPADDQD